METTGKTYGSGRSTRNMPHLYLNLLRQPLCPLHASLLSTSSVFIHMRHVTMSTPHHDEFSSIRNCSPSFATKAKAAPRLRTPRHRHGVALISFNYSRPLPSRSEVDIYDQISPIVSISAPYDMNRDHISRSCSRTRPLHRLTVYSRPFTSKLDTTTSPLYACPNYDHSPRVASILPSPSPRSFDALDCVFRILLLGSQLPVSLPMPHAM
ncbi:hypothetical protein BDN70DRAFT_380905 [Pholiota conissans]|uniref:Uncharacterized protein n=1 Tax=Pholiota conissans TaxID=109636 RepID=A0A9P5ZAF3_9AGAR|nr:hypothetical protein BDN70DRAFT_380905 [Pholiota conissans]